jgi:hypothetical protein
MGRVAARVCSHTHLERISAGRQATSATSSDHDRLCALLMRITREWVNCGVSVDSVRYASSMISDGIAELEDVSLAVSEGITYLSSVAL